MLWFSRENAAKLASGLSVAHRNADKENAAAKRKTVKIPPKVPLKKNDIKKKENLARETSVTSLYALEEVVIQNAIIHMICIIIHYINYYRLKLENWNQRLL